MTNAVVSRFLPRASAVPAALLLSLVSCVQNELPGEVVGEYRITGTLEENTCGSAAVPAADPLAFEVQIRDDQGAGIWALPKRPFVYGELSEEGDFVFKQRTSVPLAQQEPVPALVDDSEFLHYLSPEPDKESKTAACTLVQAETVKGSVCRQMDAGVPDGGEECDRAAFAGENLIEFYPAQNSSCASATSAQGGPFLALPCQVRYSLSGKLL